MSLVSTEEALLAFLWDDSDTRSTLSDAVETVTSGDGQLSQQVEVGMAAETLSERGFVSRETASDDRVRLALTEDGRDRASEVYDQLAQQEIELVGAESPTQLTVEEAAGTLEQSVPEIGATASGDGVVYRRDQQPTDGLIDRETEREAWSEVLERCRAGAGGEAVFLIGSNGIGKTTLAEELVADADEDVDVVRASCGRAATEPYEPVRELLADLGVETDPFEQAESSGETTVPGTAERASAYQAQQTALFQDVTELLAPADTVLRVLFLDDLHRADAATVAYLKHLFEQLSEHPLVVMGTHVPGKVSDTSLSVAELVEGSTRVTRLELDGLNRMETKQLIEQVVGQRGAPDEFAESIHRRTGGTPLYVESTVEALLDSDQLDPQFRWYPDSADAIELPDEVRETVSRQVEGLDDTTRDILRWTAVAGEAISVSLLQAVCDKPAERVAATTDVLAEAAIFERQDHQNSLSLRSNLTREALLAEMDESETQARHETLARYLADEDQQAGAASQHPASIAYHYEEAGDAANAIEWYRDAARQATDVYAHETAIDHYHRVLQVARQADQTDAMLSASERLADIYTTVGEYDQAENHIRFIRERVDEDAVERRQRATRLAARIATERGEYDRADEELTRGLEIDETPSEELCRLLGVAAEARRNRGRYDTARVSAERQLELATELDLPKLRAGAHRHLGRIKYRQDDHDPAREHFHECQEAADELGDQSIEAAAFHDLGLVAWDEGRLDDAEDHYQKAIEIRDEIGDRHGRARSVHNMGLVAHNRGNYQRAYELYEECRQIEHELGDQHGEAMATHNLGIIDQIRGNYDSARDCYEQCLAIEREIGDRQGVAISYDSLAALATTQGRYEEAGERLEQAVDVCREINDTKTEADSLTALGRVARLQGRYAEASEYYEQGRDLATEVGNPLTEANTLEEQGWLAHDKGDFEAAIGRFESALELRRDAGEPSETADCLRGVAATRRAQGRHDAASRALEEAWELVDGGATDTRAKVRLERAHLAVAVGDLEPGRDWAKQARGSFSEIGATHWLGRCEQVLGESAVEAGTLAEACDHLAEAVDHFETVGATPEALSAARTLVETCHEQGDSDQAQRWCTRTLEKLDEMDAHGESREWFQEQYESLGSDT